MATVKYRFFSRITIIFLILFLNLVLPLTDASAGWSNAEKMNTRRSEHSSTLLPNGKVLVVGGYDAYSNILYEAELYDPETNTWTSTGPMSNFHSVHTAVLLANGKVLIAGYRGNLNFFDCELFDPSTKQWEPTGDLNNRRFSHTMTRLMDGKVLLAGGDYLGPTAIAEIYDPDTGIWSEINPMNIARKNHTATLLPDGKVLVAAGFNSDDNELESAELYDPSTGNWTFTNNLNQDRNSHIAVLLRDGNVLVAGGNGGGVLTSAEIYNPTTGVWSPTTSMNTPRRGFTATLLPNGKVLVVGPLDAGVPEIFDPENNTWQSTDPLATARRKHTATLLPNGQVLIAGGENSTNFHLRETELFDPSTSLWEWTGDMSRSRRNHTATLLMTGKTLVVGGANTIAPELYDSNSGSWEYAGYMNTIRYWDHTATSLPDGRVLVTGGYSSVDGILCSTEIYSSGDDLWTTRDDLNICRKLHAATLLPNGKVLVTGGQDSDSNWMDSVELYEPATDIWSLTGNMIYPKAYHTITQLADGRTLVTGGVSITGWLRNTEVYNPETEVWSESGSMRFARNGHTATRLKDGRVLVAGGQGTDDPPYDMTNLVSTEIYDPITETWIETGDLNVARQFHSAILLPNGDVLVSGGYNDTALTDVEIFDPSTGSWTVVENMNIGRSTHTLNFLPNGKILAAGGGQTAEVFDSGLGFSDAWRPRISSVNSPIEIGEALHLTGFNFISYHEASGGSNYQSSATNFPIVWLVALQTGQSLWLQPDPGTPFTDQEFTSLPVIDFPGGLAQVTVVTNGIPSIAKNVLINKPPSVGSIVINDPSPTSAESVNFTVMFSKLVTGVDEYDFQVHRSGALQDGQILSVNGSENNYIITVGGYEGMGELRLDVIDDDSIQDTYNLTLGGLGIGNGDFTTGEIYAIDRIDPVLASATVWLDGLAVDAIFSEEMGTGVLDPANYLLSGTAQGNLPANPDQVVYQYDNIYRLIWDPGDPYARREMQHGGDMTITVSNVYDAVGNLIGSPDSDTDYGGGIGLAPVSSAVPHGGTYTDTIAVELICDDGEDGSGCAAIHYTVDGEDPTTSSPQYSDLITIEEYTELRFMAVDNAGNTEGINSQVYHIEKSTTISCSLSTDTIIYGESFTIFGSIGNGPPNNPDQGISIELLPASGPAVFLSTNADVNGDFALVVDCDVITDAGIWTIRSSWPGDASHLGATSTQTPLSVSQAGTSLSLDVVASESIKVNSRPPIGGDFSPLPLCSSMDLSDTPIIIVATEPDGVTVHTLSATTNQYGQFLLDFDTAEAGQPFDFDIVGEWTLSAEFSGSPEFASSDTDDVTIRVVPTAGYAIVVQGRVQSGEGMPSHHKTASFVYDKLKDRQLLDDDIQYLSWLYSNGWDGDPSKTNIQDALTVWARDKMDPNFVHPIAELDNQGQAGDLYIIMIDHGWTDPLDDEEGIFYIYPDDPLTSTELGGWVTELQSNLVGTVSEDRNIVIVLGFCRAGAFMEDLADPAYENRVVVASAAKNESSHRGPQDVDENGQPLRDGEYFVSEFFKSVSYGKSIRQCFEDATLLTESFTSSGSGVTNAPFYDDSIQHPLLNDNGDAVGSNELSSVTGEDGAISEFLYIGASPPEGNDPGDVLITQVNSAQFLGISDTQVDLWAEVDDPNDLRLIWLEIKEPNYNPVDPGAELQIEMNNFKKATTDVTGTRYTWTSVGDSPDPSDLFDIPGTYQVFYFSKDNDTGHVSPLIQSRIYKALDGNTQPNTFSLLSPADQASVLTSTILDWEDATDPEEDTLSYTILLSEDDDQFTDPIRIEGLANSAYLLSPDDGIQDLNTYYWKVLAIDAYGAIRESDTRVFDTDDTNPAFGWIMGYVTNTLDDEPVVYATVQLDVLTLSTDASGYYIGVRPPGNYDLTITAAGFDTYGPATVVITEGGTLEKNISMTPSEGDTSPIATIELPASHISIQAGGVVNFQGAITSGDAPYIYAWDFDGGATNSSQQDPGDITFSTEGIYDVTFTIVDDDGDTDSDSVTITVTIDDLCPNDPYKTAPGICGCGVPDTDTDDDTILDCDDTDDDNDGILDENDDFPLDDTETLDTDEDGIGNNADLDDDNDGINDAIESTGPNTGDANSDGVQDSLQNNVVCLISYTAQGYVILETPDGIVLSDCQTAGNPSPPDTPSDTVFYYGFFDFTISGIALGGSTTLTMTLPSGSVAPITYYKYGQVPVNQTDHWYEFMYDGQTGAEINGNEITLHFTDAIRGDDELTQDSMIIDLGAPGFDPAAVDFEPTAIITSPASNTTITAGDSVNFQGSVTSGNSPFTYAWDFDGGATNVNSEDPGSVMFSTAGTYTVIFTVTDVDNDTDSDTVTIIVTAPDDPGDNGGGGGGGGGGCFIDTL